MLLCRKNLTRSADSSGDGMGSSPKTQPRRSGVRNEESCEDSRGVVDVPVVAQPVVAPVPLIVVPVQIPDVEVAIRVAVTYGMPSMSPLLEYS